MFSKKLKFKLFNESLQSNNLVLDTGHLLNVLSLEYRRLRE